MTSDPFAAVPVVESEDYPVHRVLSYTVPALSAGLTLGPLRGKLVGMSLTDNAGTQQLTATSTFNAPAAGNAATVTVTGVAAKQVVVSTLAVSLSGTVASAPTVQLKDGASVVAQWVLPAAAGFYTLPIGEQGIAITAGATLTATCSTAGVSSLVAINVGYSILAASPVFDLYDGNDTTGQYLGTFAVPAGSSQLFSFGERGPTLQSGLYINVTGGTLKGSLWVRPEPR